jgi:hypothetical protein
MTGMSVWQGGLYCHLVAGMRSKIHQSQNSMPGFLSNRTTNGSRCQKNAFHVIALSQLSFVGRSTRFEHQHNCSQSQETRKCFFRALSRTWAMQHPAVDACLCLPFSHRLLTHTSHHGRCIDYWASGGWVFAEEKDRRRRRGSDREQVVKDGKHRVTFFWQLPLRRLCRLPSGLLISRVV